MLDFVGAVFQRHPQPIASTAERGLRIYCSRVNPAPAPTGRGDAANTVEYAAAHSTSPLPVGEGPGLTLGGKYAQPAPGGTGTGIISRRALSISCTLFLFAAALSAQPAGFSPVKDEAAFRQNFSKAGQNIRTIQSEFVQEKNLSLLEEKIVSKGQFLFQKEKKVRLEYVSPYRYLMIIDGDNITIQDEKKVNRLSARSNKMFRQINEIIVDCLAGTALGSPNYTVQPFENKTQYALVLTPKSKTLREFFNNIRVFVDKKNYVVARVELNELSGDNTIMNFSQQVLNQPLPAGVFQVKD